MKWVRQHLTMLYKGGVQHYDIGLDAGPAFNWFSSFERLNTTTGSDPSDMIKNSTANIRLAWREVYSLLDIFSGGHESETKHDHKSSRREFSLPLTAKLLMGFPAILSTNGLRQNRCRGSESCRSDHRQRIGLRWYAYRNTTIQISQVHKNPTAPEEFKSINRTMVGDILIMVDCASCVNKDISTL